MFVFLGMTQLFRLFCLAFVCPDVYVYDICFRETNLYLILLNVMVTWESDWGSEIHAVAFKSMYITSFSNLSWISCPEIIITFQTTILYSAHAFIKFLFTFYCVEEFRRAAFFFFPGIALATYFLRIAITTNISKKRRRRSMSSSAFSSIVSGQPCCQFFFASCHN